MKICQLGVRRGSDDQGPLQIGCRLAPMMFDLSLPVFSQEVEADGVLVRINFIEKALAELYKVRVFDPTLEDGKLYPLAVIEAGFGDAAESTSPIW